MKNALKRIQIEGFKTIRSCDLELRELNALIGANGAGKSNFISFFKMLNDSSTDGLSNWVEMTGGASSILHRGVKYTTKIHGILDYETENNNQQYSFIFSYIPAGDRLSATNEEMKYISLQGNEVILRLLPQELNESLNDDTLKLYINLVNLVKQTRVFQFHDTSDTALVKQRSSIDDSVSLKSDAGNLASVLLELKQNYPKNYDQIVRTIRLSAPFFNDFVLEPTPARMVLLRYSEFGSDTVFGVHQLSDGTLRFMALITLLLQPSERMPSVIIIDEPELGLHPHAIETLLSVMRSVSLEHQIIFATQSTALIDRLEPEEVIVAERHDFETTFKRLDSVALGEWLEDYSLGELWDKNVIGGRPSR